jgi:hypothetical protein
MMGMARIVMMATRGFRAFARMAKLAQKSVFLMVQNIKRLMEFKAMAQR